MLICRIRISLRCMHTCCKKVIFYFYITLILEWWIRLITSATTKMFATKMIDGCCHFAENGSFLFKKDTFVITIYVMILLFVLVLVYNKYNAALHIMLFLTYPLTQLLNQEVIFVLFIEYEVHRFICSVTFYQKKIE